MNRIDILLVCYGWFSNVRIVIIIRYFRGLVKDFNTYPMRSEFAPFQLTDIEQMKKNNVEISKENWMFSRKLK